MWDAGMLVMCEGFMGNAQWYLCVGACYPHRFTLHAKMILGAQFFCYNTTCGHTVKRMKNYTKK